MSRKPVMTALRAAGQEYVRLIQTPGFLSSLGVGLVLAAGSLGLNYAASIYADAHQSNFVRDMLLDRLPLVDTSLVVDQGMVLFAIAVAALAASFPGRVPFLVKSVALFVAVRAVFISLTHLAVYPQHIVPQQDDLTQALAYFSTDGSLFFSGHTGLPLLVALIFRDRRSIRMAFLAASIVASASVLLAHVHYTIDVLGAAFITPTIYRMAGWCFPRDLAFGLTNGIARTVHDRGLAPVAPRRKQEIPREPAGPWPSDPGWSEPAGAAIRGWEGNGCPAGDGAAMESARANIRLTSERAPGSALRPTPNVER
ncbi:MAG: phosphatase PAP2-related protein [Candidatus Methylomirabilota bacterium]|jgi:hypothetical protein